MNEFREMRRKRQQLSDEDSIDILQKGTSGTLALQGDNNYPYAVPVSYVYHKGKLYFHSAVSGHKIDAIRNCDKASFCVIGQDCVQPKEYTTYFRSVIAFGKIHIIEDETEKLAAARLLSERYNPHDEEGLQKELEKGFSRMLAIRFDIEHMTGKEAIELVRAKQNIAACSPYTAPTKSYKKVTLCGSTRFKEQFLEVQKQLTLEGYIVISVGLFGHSGDDDVWKPGVKEMLDDMHKRKIDMADEIFVINVGGYIGESTKSEIAYAKRTGKTIKYLENS